MAAFNSMIFRLVNIPLDKEEFDKELNLIIESAHFKGYDEDFILKIGNENDQKNLFLLFLVIVLKKLLEQSWWYTIS